MTPPPVTGTLHARLCATSTDHGRVHHLEVRVAQGSWIRLGGILRDESARLIETALHASPPPAGEIPREEADLAFPPRTPPTDEDLDRMARAAQIARRLQR